MGGALTLSLSCSGKIDCEAPCYGIPSEGHGEVGSQLLLIQMIALMVVVANSNNDNDDDIHSACFLRLARCVDDTTIMTELMMLPPW